MACVPLLAVSVTSELIRLNQMSNVHAWFANTTADDAASWVFSFFEETNVEPASQLSNKPQMYIAETGWPTVSSYASVTQRLALIVPSEIV